jgi:hypothetical protein
MKIGDRVLIIDKIMNHFFEIGDECFITGLPIDGSENYLCVPVNGGESFYCDMRDIKLKETSMDRIMNKLKERGLYLTLYDDWSGDAIYFETSETVFSFGNKTQLKEKLFKRTIYHPISGKQVEISEESYQAMKKDWK